MAEPTFGIAPDDDLPRTFRRERDARAAKAYPAATDMSDNRSMQREFGDDLQPSTVRRLELPFFHLAWFLVKAALAAIPALLVLGFVLWLIGAGLQAYFPQLIKMKILISFP